MQVILSNTSKKQYYRLPQTEQKKIKKKLPSVTINPMGGKKLAGEFADYRSLRAWPYRIIYSINEKEKRLEVISIEHRLGVYK
jgi:mRNA-degrading endonuclease RelE of RelBE toxin-antitoxin system